ncbi:hypothetical protein Y032_0017g3236 [Ancylostoma ceylanicum]|nr:hypothetical protein Y032_0017g3236 [Ancylostoma ceylanicum]
MKEENVVWTRLQWRSALLSWTTLFQQNPFMIQSFPFISPQCISVSDFVRGSLLEAVSSLFGRAALLPCQHNETLSH